MSVHTQVAGLYHAGLMVALVPSNRLSRAGFSRECPWCQVIFGTSDGTTVSLIFLSAHNVGENLVRWHETPLLHHLLIVVQVVRHELVHKVRVLGCNRVLEWYCAAVGAGSCHVADGIAPA
jgi:hypothetical protein